MASQFYTRLIIREMPIMAFTEKLRKQAKDEGKEEAIVYGEIARDIFSTTYKLKKVDNSLREKVIINKYLYGSGKLEFDDKTK